MAGRVLQVIPSIALEHGGPSRAIRAIERALGQAGWRSETATTDDDGRGGRRTVSSGRPMVENGGAVRWYFRKTTEFYKTAWSFVPWMFRHVSEYEVVHIHALFSFTSVVAAWAARFRGIPYIVRPLGVLNHYGISNRRPGLKRLSLRFIEAPILRHAAAVHFTAEAERDEATELRIPFREAVIPLGVETPESGDEQRFLTAHPAIKGQIRVLFLSRLDPKKNLEGLIEAIALLRAEGQPVHLLVAGSGTANYTKHLQRVAESSGGGEYISWLGYVDGMAKADALAAAQVFVLPSYSENFGIAVAEALANGLPCVVGNGVALASIVEACGAGVAVAPDPVAIANGLRPFIVSEARRNTAAAAARALAEREYSVSKMGERLAGLYASVTKMNHNQRS